MPPGGSGAFVNARVWPMRGPAARRPAPGDEPWREEHQAIAWKDGRILAVGRDADVRALAQREGLAVHEAGGRIVVPGFVDAHTHFLHIGVRRHRPDLGKSRSLQEALERVGDWLATHPGEEPVIGERWDESGWSEAVRPTRQDLDAVVAAAARAGHGPPDRQVVLRRVCGHVAVANTAALQPIRARWPEDRLVQMDSGHLFEDASLYLNEVIGTSADVLQAALEEATRDCLRLGITTVGDYSQGPYRAALRNAAVRGTLGIRVASSIYTQQLAQETGTGFRTGRPAGISGRFRDGGLKVFVDGSLGAHTAALRDPYDDQAGAQEAGGPDGPDGPDVPGKRAAADRADGTDETDGTDGADRLETTGHTHRGGQADAGHAKGKLNWSDEQVERWFRHADGAGVQVHAHAIGDAAIDQGLQAFARLPGAGRAGSGQSAGPDARNPLRHRFEHFEIAHPEQLARTAQLGIVSSSQPNFVGVWSAKGGMYEERLGARFALNNRFQDMLAAGIRVAFGSDGMPPGPLLGIAAAVAHPVPSQRLDVRQAIWHYTWWSAWSLHWEDEIGSLEPGKRADMVVLAVPGQGDQGGMTREATVGNDPTSDARSPPLPRVWTVETTMLDGSVAGGFPRGFSGKPASGPATSRLG